MNSDITFRQRILQIARVVRDLSTSADMLFAQPAFIELYEAPDAFAQAATDMYSDPLVAMLHKQIAGYAMQRLSLDKFVALVGHVTELVSRHVVVPKLLEDLAFPPFNWGAQLAVNYAQPDVRKLLERIASLEEVSPRARVNIRERVLLGRTRDDYLTLKDAGQIP